MLQFVSLVTNHNIGRYQRREVIYHLYSEIPLLSIRQRNFLRLFTKLIVCDIIKSDNKRKGAN